MASLATTVSDGNTKLVGIPNVSTTPCRACPADAPCRRQCYALKAFRMYKTARTAWNRNLKLARTDRPRFFAGIVAYLSRRQPDLFRWHVAGDILDQAYLADMVRIARQFPSTRFLCFTKMHALDYRRIPANLTIVLSMWPGWGNTRKQLPRAWMQDGSETRVPDNAMKCPGRCDNCGLCWHLREIDRDVVFNLH